MASSDSTEDSSGHQRTGDLSLFLPFMMGISDQDPNPNPDPPDRIVLINPYTQGTVVLEGPAANLDSLLRGPPPTNSPHPPASGSSIDSMPRVEKKTQNWAAAAGDDGTCVICLEEWESAREMPCGHRFHGDCVDTWLRVSGSCPVCRYTMPVDEEDELRKKSRNRGTVYYYGYGGDQREVWLSLSFNRRVAGDDDSINNINNPNPNP